MSSVKLRGQDYQYGKFSDLHLAPIAEFIQTGIRTDESSWSYAARMLKKIVPNIPKDLVDPDAGEIYLSVKELQLVYSGALKLIQSTEELSQEDPNLNSDSQQVIELKQQLEEQRKQLQEAQKAG